MKEQWRLTWLVARRELVDQLRDWRILAPMAILILFFPYLMNFTALRAIEFVNQYGANVVAERIVPFLLMVVGFFPVTVALVVALEAFVGEKERGTIEPMLSSPLADWHMYMGKLIAGSLVPLGASYISISLFLAGLIWQELPFPPLDVMTQMLLLTIVQTVLMVSAAIVISTQSTSVRAANLLASFIVIPVALLIQGESALIFWGDNEVLWLAVFGVTIVTGLVVRLGLAHFQREALIGREIDMLSMNWAIRTFWQAFSGAEQAPAWLRFISARIRKLRGGAPGEAFTLGGILLDDLRGLLRWYRVEIPKVLRAMSASIWITVALGLLAAVLAYGFVNQQLGERQLSPERQGRFTEGLRTGLQDGFPGQEIPASWLFFNNSRAELLILFFGVFSFGVLGILVYALNIALVGGLLGAVQVIGLSPWLVFVTGILPHGIFELPSVALATAAVLHMGVRLVTPDRDASIGQVFLRSLADWMKVAFGITFPLLLVAALVEAYITPALLYPALEQMLLMGK
jgi:uncharacterized membrane protein SpoIIM required for sporulation